MSRGAVGDVPPSDQRPDFVERVMAMVRTIPPGRVMTCGDIALALTARAESMPALEELPDGRFFPLPWAFHDRQRLGGT